MDIKTALGRLIAGESLDHDAMTVVMRQVMTGETTPAQTGALLTAMRMKGETVDELTAAAGVMRELSLRVEPAATTLIDTCGTGGTGRKLFNVSTASAFVAAAGGAHVAKHGNRGATSSSGSADLLEAAGARLDLTPAEVARCIDATGVGFMFAVNHHGAMKHAIGPRRELGFRTFFNLLGPMTNPAGARRQVLGVAHREAQRPVAEVLQRLGSEHVLVVHSEDGLDEISPAAPTRVIELKHDSLSEWVIGPEQLGVEPVALDTLVADSPAASLERVRTALADETSGPSRMVQLNAGAALVVAGISRDLREGVALANDLVASGQAAERFLEFVRFTGLVKEMEA